MLADENDHDAREPSRPAELDETIRTVICTSDTPQDLAGRVQRAIGEHASPTDELHISHAIAPHPDTRLLLYSALIVLRPAERDSD